MKVEDQAWYRMSIIAYSNWNTRGGWVSGCGKFNSELACSIRPDIAYDQSIHLTLIDDNRSNSIIDL